MVANKKSKAKKTKRPGKASGVNSQPQNAENNAFAIAAATKGTKRKFPVLGQVSKSAQATAPKAGGRAAKEDQSRKKALLIEYRKFGKSNSFVDRRFGEYNNELTAEDKSIARLQKQRTKQLGGGRFTLASEDDQLTHMGKSLDELDEDGDAFNAFEDEADDEDLNRETVERLHFGGGNADSSADKHKTKKEVMEEIISKSKAGKAVKAQQKEEDVVLQEELDDEFKELMEGRLMSKMIRPTGAKAKDVAADEDDAAYDKAQRSLVFGARAQPGERTKTTEELAVIESERLERMERERVRRMHASGADDEENDSDGDQREGLSGGFAARRKRRKLGESQAISHDAEHRSGDAEDDFDLDDDPSGDEDGSERDGDAGSDDEHAPATAVEARRQVQAAGDHELQQNFRLASAQLLMKYGMGPTGKTAEELGEDDEESDEDQGEESEGGEEDGKDEDGDEEDEDSEKEGSLDDGLEETLDAKDDLGGDKMIEKDGAAGLYSRNAKAQVNGVKDEVTDRLADVPYTIKAPGSYHEFSRLVTGRSAEDMMEILRRIRATNALALGQDNRRKLQVFYGILVQHFVILAGEEPLPLQMMDAVAAVLQPMTSEVPFYAATVAQARLSKVQDRLNDANWIDQDPSVLPVRSLMLLKLLTQVFPTTDARHPVMTPAALIVGAAVSRIAAEDNPLPVNILRGLFLSQLAMHMTAQSSRFAPEALSFCCNVLSCLGTNQDAMTSSIPAGGMKTLSLSKDLCRKHGDAWFTTNEFKTGVLQATLKTIDRLIGLTAGFSSCPEMLRMIDFKVSSLIDHTKNLPPGLQDMAADILSRAQRQATDAVAKRTPLTHSSKTKTAAVKTFNPRFEDDFAKGRDYDPDREKADERRLKKEVNRERRATVRGLRKDSALTANIRDAEKKAVADDRHDKAMSAISWLQSFEANMKSGGQGGMHKGKKSRK